MLIKDEKKCGRTLLESFIFPTTDGPISTQKAHTFLPAHIPVKMYSTGKKKNQLHQTTWNLVEMSVMDRTREKVSRTHDWHRTSKLTSWDQRSNFAYMCPNYRRSISRQIDGAKLWFLLLSLPSNFGEACFQTLMILLMVSALIILWFPPSNMQGASSKIKTLSSCVLNITNEQTKTCLGSDTQSQKNRNLFTSCVKDPSTLQKEM